MVFTPSDEIPPSALQIATLIASLGMSTQPATVVAGETAVVVAHTLAAIPGIVNVENEDDLGGRTISISAKTTTHFTLNISSADLADHSFVTRAYK